MNHHSTRTLSLKRIEHYLKSTLVASTEQVAHFFAFPLLPNFLMWGQQGLMHETVSPPLMQGGPHWI